MAKTEQGDGLESRGATDKLTDNGKGGVFGAELNGGAIQEEDRVDKYGFTGGAQQNSGESEAYVWKLQTYTTDAFWVLVQICEKYLPGYYSTGLEAIQLDGEILYALLRRVSPAAHGHLKKHKLEPILYMTEWFMCAFSRTLPWASVLRVWDMFLFEGVKILFKVGLVLLKCMLGSQEKLKSCQGLYETMELLRAIQPQYMQERFLVHEIIELSVSEKDIEREHHAQLRRWKESHGDLHCKSPPRMHGAKAIMAAEPPSRQDLRQRPTIIVASPLATTTDAVQAEDAKGNRKTNREQQKETILSPQETLNPYPPPTDPSPLLRHMTFQESKESLSSTEHDTYL
nr:PREDICTED: TBC1 domain family member 10A-like [Paralichthys olivaceus]